VNRAYIRLASGYVILIGVVFLILGIYLVQRISDAQHDSWMSEQRATTEMLGATLAPATRSADTTLLQDQLSQLNESGNIAVMSTDGSVLAGDPVRDSTTLATAPDVDTALTGQSGSTQFTDPLTGQRMQSFTEPILDGTTLYGVLVRSIPASDAPGTWTPLTRLTVLVLVICAVGIAAVSAFMPRIITAPMAELTSVARRVSRGDLHARADTDTWDELAELAGAFNEMTGELRDQLQAIDYERARLEAILEHLNDGILIVNPRGTVTLINRAAEGLLGVDRERALIRTYAEVVRDHELVGLIRNSHRLYDPAMPLPSRFIELGRPRRAVQAFAYPIAQGDNQLVIVILRDITELRKTETVRRDFVANVSHDLRTPIASLKALVDTLLAGALEDETVARDFLSRMEVEVDDLARLVEELLELSRAESRRIELHQIPADIGNLLRRVAARLQTHAEPKSITFRTSVPEDLPRAFIDPERIEQVLVNLMHNAIKFSPEASEIRLAARQDEDDLEISVSDSGPGIPPDELDRVFERFYKTEKSRSDTGSGLGLAIARHLVQLHGGRIWAESEPRGGTTFRLTVQVAPDDYEVPDWSQQQSADKPATER
jgi:two-component system, OmpR family, phosphate regulon sensor histidine kinase PhoR